VRPADRRSGGRQLAEPHTPAATALRAIAERLAVRARGLAGRSLNISPA
jgi:ATP-binding protein involved in chromosome partitioning